MNKYLKIISTLLIFSLIFILIISSCNIPKNPSATKEPGTTGTVVDTTGADHTDIIDPTDLNDTGEILYSTFYSAGMVTQNTTDVTGEKPILTANTAGEKTFFNTNSSYEAIRSGATGKPTTSKSKSTPTPTKKIVSSDNNDLTLRYWVNFPDKGIVKTTKSYSFNIAHTANGVSVTAYNRSGSKNPASSVDFINTWIYSYEIIDSDKNVLESKNSEAGYSDFKMDIRVSGACRADKKEISFRGYYKDFKGSNAVVVSESKTTSFAVIRGSSSWTYSTEYSTFDKSIISVSNNGGTLNCQVSFKNKNTVYADSFSTSHFIYVPNDTINNGLPTMLINMENSKDYETIVELKGINNHSNPDKDNRYIKSEWLEASFAIVEGTSKSYNTKTQQGTLEISRRGNTSFGHDKKPYSIDLTKKMRLLGMKSSSKDWALIASHADHTLLRNSLAYNVGKTVVRNGYSPDCRSIELYIGKNDGTAVYLGTYLLVERIRVEEERVNIKEMTEKDTVDRVYPTDSYNKIMEGSFLVETNDPARLNYNDVYMVKPGWYQFQIRSPGRNVLEPAPFDYRYSSTWVNNAPSWWSSGSSTNATKNMHLTNYIYSFIFDVAYPAINNAAVSDKVFDYIDINSFVDYYIINELSKNPDGVMISTYYYKEKGGKLKIVIWDFDLAFGNCNYGKEGNITENCDTISGFYIKHKRWYNQLFKNNTFRNAVKARWAELRKSGGALANDKLTTMIDGEASKISVSAASNFNLWEIMGKNVQSSPTAIRNLTTHTAHVNYLKKWVTDRANWLDINIPLITD